MNIANKITMLRVVLVPIFLYFMINSKSKYNMIIAMVIFFLASITDALDGYIARTRNLVTDFGKLIDPIADKVLVTAALLALVYLDVIGVWAVIIILSREYAVSALRLIASSKGIVVAASSWGKIKTIIQMITIIFALMYLILKIESMLNILNGLIFVMVIITIYSGIDYFIKNNKIIESK